MTDKEQFTALFDAVANLPHKYGREGIIVDAKAWGELISLLAELGGSK